MPRYRIIYSKRGPARYISHLDLVRALERSMRRAGLPIAFSEGFNPHPRMSFAAPLPVGIEGLAEVMDVEMTAPVPRRDLADRLNAALPPGLAVKEVLEVADNAPAPMAVLDKAAYIVHLDADDLPAPLFECTVEEFLALDKVEVSRRGKNGREKTRDIRPGIIKMEVQSRVCGLTMRLELKTGSAMNVRPEEAMTALFRHAGIPVDPVELEITRMKLFAGDSGLD
ncbi:TIGR03936 family radical SAM-associated protein [Desulfoscipio geothermicus]|uniref:Radical SAM-linked protein n=1 Tax=Desulfoscipio geothermicus DSM 3669 TaxID=1121426 RepID=A0A1I6DSA6_9FIRM|nr:TIGR03936 family radical SAM-associated protein [Desulfoscipio geothermicus]SFR08251.1 radical SAM-linked protein [Desulfoscipio geothermicus DSM 3669]